MEQKTRRIVQTGVTKYPTDEWTAPPLREATPGGRGPKNLMRDRDRKYARPFSAVASRSGIQERKTPDRSPPANGICERFRGRLRRECLDPMLLHPGRPLPRGVQAYTAYSHEERPPQGISQRIPEQLDLPKFKPASGRLTSKTILGGLPHSYSRTLYLSEPQSYGNPKNEPG